MPDLSFDIESAAAVPFAATPLMAFHMRVANATDEPIHAVALRCQIQIEATRRRYSPDEQSRLVDLFGEPDRWSHTLRSMLWTHANVVIPRFTGNTAFELPVTCTFDFNVAATKYFYGLTSGELPLDFLFSGTVFYEGREGALQVAPIPWDKEVRYRLPVSAWRELMDTYYPNSAWLALRRDAFDLLYRFKMRYAIPTWEETVERVLTHAEASDVARPARAARVQS